MTPLDNVVEVAANAMDEVLGCFRPGCKITLLVRTPGHPSRDFCLTDDDLYEVASMIKRRQSEAENQRLRAALSAIRSTREGG